MTVQYISDTIAFGKDHSNSLSNIIKNFPKLEPKPIKISVNSNIVMTSEISAKIYSQIAADASIEKKVEFLMHERERMDKILNNLNDNIELKLTPIKTELKDLNKNFEKSTSMINSLISGHIVGSLDKTILGIILTLCGIIIQLFNY